MNERRKPGLIVAGSVAQQPFLGGLAWVFMHLANGLKRLGWDVTFVDRLEPGMYVDVSGRPAETPSFNAEYFTRLMRAFRVERYCLLGPDHQGLAGIDRRELVRKADDAAAVIDVMGYLGDSEILGRVGQRVFFDIDPGFWHMWCENGSGVQFGGHDAYVTIGENIGRPECDIPTCGIDWVTTPQPIVLSEWEPASGSEGAVTSVVSWRGPYGPIDHAGKTYGLRVHEFRKFVSLPQRTGERFELALDIDPADVHDRGLLESSGWVLADPLVEAGDPWRYREYIRRSKAEFMVAKNIYVATRSGWFSDRSLCYLASGKPVLAQDTGFGDHYPTGEGLLAFSTLEEAIEGIEEIAADYDRHSRAARAIAEEFFDSDKVLSRLLDRLGIDES